MMPAFVMRRLPRDPDALLRPYRQRRYTSFACQLSPDRCRRTSTLSRAFSNICCRRHVCHRDCALLTRHAVCVRFKMRLAHGDKPSSSDYAHFILPPVQLMFFFTEARLSASAVRRRQRVRIGPWGRRTTPSITEKQNRPRLHPFRTEGPPQ